MGARLSLTVSQLNAYVQQTLRADPMLLGVELRGEISGLKPHQSGAIFFTMKDEQASIACVMFAQDAERLAVAPFEGMRALAVGSAGLYARTGQFRFVVTELAAQGVGVLFERMEALKRRLAAQGLFDAERKRPIPDWIDTIGVVSSPTGAVIHDILTVSLRRDPSARVLLCPARVQGAGAAQEVARAIAALEQVERVSVIIVARGGGSAEDLFTFNEEEVVRAVARCTKPIVSAIGHETDVTLCDLAADLRAATPSAAAECVTPLRAAREAQLTAMRDALKRRALAAVERQAEALAQAQKRLSLLHPVRQLAAREGQLVALRQALTAAGHRALDARADALARKRRELALLSPDQVLRRGYVLVQRDGCAVDAAAKLRRGDAVTLRFADGVARAAVTDAPTGEEKADGGQEEKADL